MAETIQTIAADLTRRVGEWLSQDDETTRGVIELRERAEALRISIGASAAAEVLRALSGSERTIQEARKKEAATVIAAALRELGIRVDPGAPLKRVRKASTKRPKSETVTVDGDQRGRSRTLSDDKPRSNWNPSAGTPHGLSQGEVGRTG